MPLPLDVDAESVGGSGDWTSFSEGAPESGGSGRKKRMGTLRKGWLGGGRRILEILWKEWRSTIVVSLYVSGFLLWVLYLPSCTASHNPAESSFDKLMIPLAVPFRRKSASLTLLINASFMTIPSASSRTSSSSGQSLKCTVNRQGSVDDPLVFFVSQSLSSVAPLSLEDAESASA